MAAPNTPTIYVPKNGDTNRNRNLWIVTDEYSAPLGSPGFLYSDWQVATDEDFDNIVWEDIYSDKQWINQVSVDTGSFEGALTTKQGLYWEATYYVRVRWANTDGAGDWSTAVQFSIMLGTDWTKYIVGGASSPVFIITGDEISFYDDGVPCFRTNTYFDNQMQGWDGAIHDTTSNHIARTAHVFGQHALRIVDDSAVAAESSFIDWTPEASSYGMLVILWLKASSTTTATLALMNAQAAFDPADCLTLKKISVSTVLQPYVLYYPRLRALDYSNARRLYIFPTEADVVADEATVDVCRCILRDVTEELVMPVPTKYQISFTEEHDDLDQVIDGSENVAKKGFRMNCNIEFPFLSIINEIKRRKVANAEQLFMLPHFDVDWATEIWWPGKYDKGYFADKLMHGHSGNIEIQSREVFPSKPKELIEV